VRSNPEEAHVFRKLHLSAFALLVLSSEVYAQATAPASPGGTTAPGAASGAPPAGTADGSGGGWLLPLIVLLVVAAAVWYFMNGRKRTLGTTAGPADLGGTTTTRSAGITGSPGVAGTTTGTTAGTPDPSIRVYDDNK
jgi:hypothetical protein